MGVPLPDRRTGILAIVVMMLVFVPVLGQAAEAIGVVDYQVIFDDFEGTQDAQTTLDREMKEWEQEAKSMRDEIATLTEEYESQKLMLSEERLSEKERDLDRLRGDYESFVESIWGVDGKAARRNVELTKPIAEQILDVIERIGQEKNLQIILDAGTGGVVWAEDDLNITQLVKDDLSLGIGRPDDQGPQTPPAGGVD